MAFHVRETTSILSRSEGRSLFCHYWNTSWLIAALWSTDKCSRECGLRARGQCSNIMKMGHFSYACFLNETARHDFSKSSLKYLILHCGPCQLLRYCTLVFWGFTFICFKDDETDAENVCNVFSCLMVTFLLSVIHIHGSAI